MTPRFDPALIPSTPSLDFENAGWQQGCTAIGGIDEAGRGAWAGPVVAAVLVLPAGQPGLKALLYGVRDSKQMTARQRSTWADKIKAACRGWGVGEASPAEIDALGILPATRLAAQRALACLSFIPDRLLIDYITLPEVALPQHALVKGDARVLSIAGASVLAKTARDAVMEGYDKDYPGYGFARHKGYGTALHLAALRELGPAAIHRMTFAPVKEIHKGSE